MVVAGVDIVGGTLVKHVNDPMVGDTHQNYRKKKGIGKRMIEISTNVMENETILLGNSKKALEDKFLKFIKRLNTIESEWLIINDMWMPAERSKKTRPGLHIAYNPHLAINKDCTTSVYRTLPIPDILNDIEAITERKKKILYIQNAELISLEIDIGGTTVLVPIARALCGEEREQKVPGILYGSTFKKLIDRAYNCWVDITHRTLQDIKSGNVFQISQDGFVMMRLVRSLFKLRGRSERANADINYSASYSFENLNPDNIMNMGGITFTLFVSYGFMYCAHRYIPVPYPEDPNGSIADLMGNVDLGLFDEDDADDGLDVVD